MTLGPVECLWHLDHHEGHLGTVLDIGAYHGVFSMGAAKRGAREVHAIEADVDNYLEMKDAINKAAMFNNIRTMNLAVTKSGGSVNLYGRGSTSSVMFRDVGRERRVPSISFKRLLTIMAPIDYLKMDIEGAEHEIFEGENVLAGLLMNVRFMEVEIHKLTGDEKLEALRRDRLIEWLQDVGFDGDPCNVRKVHSGAFCSYNRYFRETEKIEYSIPVKVAAPAAACV